MRITIFREISLCALILVSTGCTKMYLDASAIPEGTYFNNMASFPGAQSKGSFEVKVQTVWTLFGLVTIKKADIGVALQKEMQSRGGNAVVGLTIKTQQTFVDGLVGFLTLTFYQPRTITLKGQVVNILQTSWAPDMFDVSVAKRSIEKGVLVYSFPGYISSETSLVFN